MFSGHEKEEVTISFDPRKDNYMTFDLRAASYPKTLFDFTDSDGKVMATTKMEPDGTFSLADQFQEILVKTPSELTRCNNHQILGIRLGDRVSGFKLKDTIYEKYVSIFPNRYNKLFLRIKDEYAVRVMGRGSGRAARWAELFYHRTEPKGLGVELITDWHHIRAGIPFTGTMTSEKLIEQGVFRLKFRSYAYAEEETRDSDFVRLFGSNASSDISVHITPPLYSYAHVINDLPNIGFFVTESMSPQHNLINRCNQMDSIFVPSRFAYKAFKRNGVHRPMRVIPHAVDIDFFQPVSQKMPLPGGRGFNFLAISTHVERKNIKYVVRAFLEEFREHEDVSLFLLLRPEYHTTQNNVALEFTEWEGLYMRNSAPIYLWTDYVTNEHLRHFYANANAYVMPSNEGFGLTLLEAMACGTPVIGLNYGGVLDFLNSKTGYIVPRGRSFISKNIDSMQYIGDRFYKPNLQKLRSIMRYVFENESKAKQKGIQARQNCEQHFTWDIVTKKFSRLIEETYIDFRKSPRKNYLQPDYVSIEPKLSWILCVLDSTSIKSSLRYLRGKKKSSSYILCLFTRYAFVKDILRVRKHKYLFYSWDGSQKNCEAIATSLLGRGWKGIIYPGEKTQGNEEQLATFLTSLPDSVTRVSVTCRNGKEESRFFRYELPNVTPKSLFYTEFCIR
jgi:glycosyltransferase involved in cell wall biosynthesis